MILNTPPWFGSQLLRLTTISLGNIPGSTLQSIKRRKTTEIDYLDGEIVVLGEKYNVPQNSDHYLR